MKADTRILALRSFAVAITVLNLLGHTVLGFEQSWAQLVTALVTAYAVELLLEVVEARREGREPVFVSRVSLVDFLLPAHISGLAVAMLLYANDRLWPFAFAAATAICSKALVRVPVERGTRHVLNPSNTGIGVTLLLFPWIGIAPPYHFTEELTGWWDWLLPAIVLTLGTLLNARLTGRIPLIAGWIAGFAGQALARAWLTGAPLAAMLNPMTGLAFLLYTFYMITDPGTTPAKPRAQAAFGAAVAVVYGLLMMLHVVYTYFFALLAVCAGRALFLYAASRSKRNRHVWEGMTG